MNGRRRTKAQADADIVKANTKKGPGVRARLHEALRNLTPEQREVARSKGWDKGL